MNAWRATTFAALAVAVVLIVGCADDLKSQRGEGYAVKIRNVLTLDGRDAAMEVCREADERLTANRDEEYDWAFHLGDICNQIIDGELVKAGEKLQELLE